MVPPSRLSLGFSFSFNLVICFLFDRCLALLRLYFGSSPRHHFGSTSSVLRHTSALRRFISAFLSSARLLGSVSVCTSASSPQKNREESRRFSWRGEMTDVVQAKAQSPTVGVSVHPRAPAWSLNCDPFCLNVLFDYSE